jgi:hypothetical protein
MALPFRNRGQGPVNWVEFEIIINPIKIIGNTWDPATNNDGIYECEEAVPWRR